MIGQVSGQGPYEVFDAICEHVYGSIAVGDRSPRALERGEFAISIKPIVPSFRRNCRL